MTVDERFERIEHMTAGLAEQFRNDREENRQLWRDTQKEMGEAITRTNDAIARTNETIDKLAADSAAADKRLEARIDQLAGESRTQIKELGERIDNMVSSIGKLISRLPAGPGTS